IGFGLFDVHACYHDASSSRYEAKIPRCVLKKLEPVQESRFARNLLTYSGESPKIVAKTFWGTRLTKSGYLSRKLKKIADFEFAKRYLIRFTAAPYATSYTCRN